MEYKRGKIQQSKLVKAFEYCHCLSCELLKILPVKFTTLIRHIYLPLQPSGPKPKVPGAQRSHRLPTTFALHWHAPPRELHSALTEPVGSHWQSEKEIIFDCCNCQKVMIQEQSCSPSKDKGICEEGSQRRWNCDIGKEGGNGEDNGVQGGWVAALFTGLNSNLINE